MLDSRLHPRLRPVLNAIARVLDRPGISPDGLTLFGFCYRRAGAAVSGARLVRRRAGSHCAEPVAGWLGWRAGAAARPQRRRRISGYLARFFCFYALVPFGFIVADPAQKCAGGRLAAVCVYRHRQQFPRRLQHSRQSIKLPIRAMRINHFIILAG